MIEVTKFKLYPNKETEDKLFSNLSICSFVYNWCLEHSIWKDSVLPQLKEVYPDIKEVHSIVLQNVVHQVRDNIKALSESKKKGKKVGRLRHKFRHSMIYEQTGFKIDGNYLRLSRIGSIPITISRPIEGTIKQIIIKHNNTHNWFASVVSDNGMEPEKTSGTKVVGIDLNVSNFSTDSDGLVVDHPKNFKKAEKKLKRQQQKLSRKIRGSHNLIALEDLSIAGLVQSGNRGLSKAILDASWGKFANYISYKAENAGKYAVQVIAKGTTQDCSVCGKTVAKDLSVRTHSCPYCGSVMPRDYNSAWNIKLRGIEMVGWGTPESGILNMGKLNTLAEIRTSILDVNNPQQVFVNEPRISRL